MSKKTQEFFENLKSGQEPGLASMLKAIGGKIWDIMTPMAEHGAHELTSALFRGDGYVMYPHQGRTDQADSGPQPDVTQEQREQHGREM